MSNCYKSQLIVLLYVTYILSTINNSSNKLSQQLDSHDLKGLWISINPQNTKIQNINFQNEQNMVINSWDVNNNQSSKYQGNIVANLLRLRGENDKTFHGKIKSDHELDWIVLDRNHQFQNEKWIKMNDCTSKKLSKQQLLKNVHQTDYNQNLKSFDFGYCVFSDMHQDLHQNKPQFTASLQKFIGLYQNKQNPNLLRKIETNENENNLKVTGWNSSNNKTWTTEGSIDHDEITLQTLNTDDLNQVKGTINHKGDIQWKSEIWAKIVKYIN